MKKVTPDRKTTQEIDLPRNLVPGYIGYILLLCDIFGYSKPQVKFRNADDLALAVFEGKMPCLLSNEATDAVNAVLATLTNREVVILQRIYGIGNHAQSQTPEEIADELALAPSKVRAIKARALQKLRHPSRSEKLRDIPVTWADVFSQINQLKNELKKTEAQFDEFANRMNVEMGKYREAAAAAANILFPLTQNSGENPKNSLEILLQKPMSDFELSVRAQNCLKLANIETLGDLASKTEAEMLRIRNLGQHALNELKQILSAYGLNFGMTTELLSESDVKNIVILAGQRNS